MYTLHVFWVSSYKYLSAVLAVSEHGFTITSSLGLICLVLYSVMGCDSGCVHISGSVTSKFYYVQKSEMDRKYTEYFRKNIRICNLR
jgi:hypothetical protein